MHIPSLRFLLRSALHCASPSIFCSRDRAALRSCCTALHCMAVLCLLVFGRTLRCAALGFALRCFWHCTVLRCSANGFPILPVRFVFVFPFVFCLLLPPPASSLLPLVFFSLLHPSSWCALCAHCALCVRIDCIALRCIAPFLGFLGFFPFFPMHITFAGALYCPRRVFIDSWTGIASQSTIHPIN